MSAADPPAKRARTTTSAIPEPPELVYFYYGQFYTRKQLAVAAKVQLSLGPKEWNIYRHFANLDLAAERCIVMSLRSDHTRPMFTIMHKANMPEPLVTDILSDSEFLAREDGRWAKILQLPDYRFESFVSELWFRKMYPLIVDTLKRLRQRSRHYFDYTEAAAYIRDKAPSVHSTATYAEMRKETAFMQKLFPPRPHEYYADTGWTTFEAFCGRTRFLEYPDACRVVRDAGIVSRHEYKQNKKYKSVSARLPAAPEVEYKGKGWKGWALFLRSDVF